MIGDGAPWIWNIADEQFHGATHIVDLYHAREHYWDVARVYFVQSKEQIASLLYGVVISVTDGKIFGSIELRLSSSLTSHLP